MSETSALVGWKDDNPQRQTLAIRFKCNSYTYVRKVEFFYKTASGFLKILISLPVLPEKRDENKCSRFATYRKQNNQVNLRSLILNLDTPISFDTIRNLILNFHHLFLMWTYYLTAYRDFQMKLYTKGRRFPRFLFRFLFFCHPYYFTQRILYVYEELRGENQIFFYFSAFLYYSMVYLYRVVRFFLFSFTLTNRTINAQFRAL